MHEWSKLDKAADETVTNYGTSTSICGCTRANCRHKFADGLTKSLKKEDYQVQQINNSFLKREYHQPPANNHTVPLLRNPWARRHWSLPCSILVLFSETFCNVFLPPPSSDKFLWHTCEEKRSEMRKLKKKQKGGGRTGKRQTDETWETERWQKWEKIHKARSILVKLHW